MPYSPFNPFYLFDSYFLLLIALCSSRKVSHRLHQASFGKQGAYDHGKNLPALKLRRHAGLEA
jgi:hypothetical protein